MTFAKYKRILNKLIPALPIKLATGIAVKCGLDECYNHVEMDNFYQAVASANMSRIATIEFIRYNTTLIEFRLL